MLFIDIVGAFANIARALIINVEMPDEYIAYLFKTFNSSESILVEFRSTLKSISAMSEAGVPDSLQGLGTRDRP
jgi:hypothetical protein